jgi:hypothetical protein
MDVLVIVPRGLLAVCGSLGTVVLDYLSNRKTER